MSVVRRINPVAILLLLIVAAAVYLAWKIVPVYYQATEVDNILSGYKQEAAELDPYNASDQHEERIVDRIRDDLIDLGLDDPLVSFGAGYASIDVSYAVTVHFLFGQSHTFHFDRSMEVPQDDR